MATAIKLLVGGAVAVALGVAMGEWSAFDADAVSVRSVAGLVYLTVFGSGVAFTSYLWLLKVSTPAKVGSYAFVNPVIALALGCAFAGEAIDAGTVFAAALIVASVVLVMTGAAREPHE